MPNVTVDGPHAYIATLAYNSSTNANLASFVANAIKAGITAARSTRPTAVSAGRVRRLCRPAKSVNGYRTPTGRCHRIPQRVMITSWTSAPIANLTDGNTDTDQSILVGSGNLVFNALGAGSIFGGGGNIDFVIPARNSGSWDIALGNGADTIKAFGSGNDTISLGSGPDTIQLGAGNSVVTTSGAATISGSTGNETVTGNGTTVIYGNSSNLAFVGGGGATVFGGTGSVSAIGGTGPDYFQGGSAGNNFLKAGSGAATLLGGGNGDQLFANGSGAQILYAGSGNETLNGSGAGGADTFVGSAGNTTVMASTSDTTCSSSSMAGRRNGIRERPDLDRAGGCAPPGLRVEQPGECRVAKQRCRRPPCHADRWHAGHIRQHHRTADQQQLLLMKRIMPFTPPSMNACRRRAMRPIIATSGPREDLPMPASQTGIRPMQTGLRLATAAFVATLGFGAPARADVYNFANVQDPNGVGGTVASGINDAGVIVGSYTDGSNNSNGFTLIGGTYNTVNVPSEPMTTATGVSNSGTITGYYSDSSGGVHGYTQPVAGGAVTATFDVPGAMSGGATYASATNASGTTVGYYLDNVAAAVHGFTAPPTTGLTSPAR